MLYRIIWKIDIDAETAEQAAIKALLIHRDPMSTATVFDVEDENGIIKTVDLNEI